jgi:predicted alpha/beta superfamily hydrolase
MDYTPSKYKNNLVFKNGPVPLDESATGGADEFIAFLKTKVFKTVENEYKIKGSTRGILGHSLGGLFGFYTYANYPELFSNYILIAPSLWWNQSELLVDKELLVSKTTANMFIAMGSNEIKLMKAPMPIFVQELSQPNNSKLRMVYKEYQNEDHHSVLPQSIYDALEFIYSNNKD